MELAPFLSVALERSSISFGQVFAGQTPPSVSEHVTVVSNNSAGYVLTVHRTTFAPADLPLGIAPSATAALAPIPVAPAADFVLASASAAHDCVGRRLARECRLHECATRAAAGPVHVDDHVHGDRAVIVAPPPTAALTASPARIELVGAGVRTVRVANPGRAGVVVEAGAAGFGLDLRGRPRIVVRRDTAVRVSVSPGRLALGPGAAASLEVTSRVGAHARPGDHELLVVLATRRLAGAGVSIRMQVGIVVVVRVPGAVVRRLDVRGMRVRAERRLDVMLLNSGNVVERIGRATLRIVLRRHGRVLATLRPAPRELLPGARGIVEARYPSDVRGRVDAAVELAGRTTRFRLRLP